MMCNKISKTAGIYIMAVLTACSLTSCAQEVEESDNSSKAEISVSADSAEEITEAEITEDSLSEITEAVTEIATEAPTESITEISTQEATDADEETADYMTAYLEFLSLSETDPELTYDIIDINDDDIPELVIGKNSFYISIYTYIDNHLYVLAEQWPYGAMGIAGYEYAPKMNSIRESDADWAGLIRFTAYYSMNDEYTLEMTNVVETRLFEDTNGNGMPDEDEEYIPDYYVYLVDDKEISAEEAASYDVGEYEFIIPEMTLDEIKAALS